MGCDLHPRSSNDEYCDSCVEADQQDLTKLRALRQRVEDNLAKWDTVLVDYIKPCPVCGGSGVQITRKGSGVPHEKPCNLCNGSKTYIDDGGEMAYAMVNNLRALLGKEGGERCKHIEHIATAAKTLQ